MQEINLENGVAKSCNMCSVVRIRVTFGLVMDLQAEEVLTVG